MTTKKLPWQRKKKRFNQMKAIVLLLTGIIGAVSGFWWQTALFLLVAWMSHEVLWSDHIFYDPRDDYLYTLRSDIQYQIDRSQRISLPAQSIQNNKFDTWILVLKIKATGVTGRIFDPRVTLRCENKQREQYFERGGEGIRYLNLSDFSEELRGGQTVSVSGLHCTLTDQGILHGFCNPDYSKKRILVVSPHADDAELSAFGLYSQSDDVNIVTLTAGEVGMEGYFNVYPQPEKASVLKGQLRAMDSIAIPLWGGITQQKCIQLGYFCERLKDMQQQPEKEFASHTAKTSDTRVFRQFNSQKLSSDQNGKPTWNNLVQDLVELLESIKPEVIITPNPDLDPHQDHIYGTKAIREAIEQSAVNPEHELLYTNHLRTTDMFSFGPAHSVASLPPDFSGHAVRVFSCQSDLNLQKKKVLSLRMMHDLKDKWILKKQLRSYLQELFIGRKFLKYGSEPYLNKAVKHNEIFLVAAAD